MLTLELPIKTVSEANAHAHWRTRQKRARGQRGTVRLALASRPFTSPVHDIPSNPGGLKVRITRIAPRSLDSDNLAGSQKHVRDGVADALGINDNDPRVTWLYDQARGEPKTYGVRIEIWSGEP